MKKVFILAAIMILWAGMVFGAGTSAITSVTPYANGWTKVLVTFTADATDGTVPSLNILGFDNQWLCQIVTNPGTTGPTDNYDIYLKYDGADLLGGAGVDRDTANTEIAYPIIDSVSGQRACVPVPGTLVFSLANNSVKSAVGTMEIHFKRTSD
jgi:hypothetical protein